MAGKTNDGGNPQKDIGKSFREGTVYQSTKLFHDSSLGDYYLRAIASFDQDRTHLILSIDKYFPATQELYNTHSKTEPATVGDGIFSIRPDINSRQDWTEVQTDKEDKKTKSNSTRATATKKDKQPAAKTATPEQRATDTPKADTKSAAPATPAEPKPEQRAVDTPKNDKADPVKAAPTPEQRSSSSNDSNKGFTTDRLFQTRSASNLADMVDEQVGIAQRGSAQLKDQLNKWVSNDGGLANVLLGTAAATALDVSDIAMNFLKTSADPLRFGEGFAEGGWKGIGTDIMRGVSLLPAAKVVAKGLVKAGAAGLEVAGSVIREAQEANGIMGTSLPPVKAEPMVDVTVKKAMMVGQDKVGIGPLSKAEEAYWSQSGPTKAASGEGFFMTDDAEISRPFVSAQNSGKWWAKAIPGRASFPGKKRIIFGDQFVERYRIAHERQHALQALNNPDLFAFGFDRVSSADYIGGKIGHNLARLLPGRGVTAAYLEVDAYYSSMASSPNFANARLVQKSAVAAIGAFGSLKKTGRLGYVALDAAWAAATTYAGYRALQTKQ